MKRTCMSHGSPCLVHIQILKHRMLCSFRFSVIKTLKTAELKHTKKCFILTEMTQSATESSDKTLVN